MKKNKFLAVIALIALTGFLGIACSSGGGSAGEEEEEDFISQYKERDRDTALIPAFKLDRNVAVVVDTDYDTDIVYYTLTNFVLPVTITDIVSPAGFVDVDTSTAGQIEIEYSSTANGTVKIIATDANGVAITKVITVYSLDANALDDATLTLVTPIPNITYYDSDVTDDTGVWKDINVKVTSNAFPGSYITVPLSGCTFTDPFAIAAIDLAANRPLAASYGPYDVTFATATKRLIPALTIKEDKVDELAVTGNMQTTYFQVIDPNVIDFNALTFAAYWLNPRHVSASFTMTPERSGKFRSKEAIGGWLAFSGILTDTTANNDRDDDLIFKDGSDVEVDDPLDLMLVPHPADEYSLKFKYQGTESKEFKIRWNTVILDSLFVGVPAGTVLDIVDAEFEAGNTAYATANPGAGRDEFLFAALKETGIGIVTVDFEGPDATAGYPVIDYVEFANCTVSTDNAGTWAAAVDVGDTLTVLVNSIGSAAALTLVTSAGGDDSLDFTIIAAP